MTKLTPADLEAEIAWEGTFTAGHAVTALRQMSEDVDGTYLYETGKHPPFHRLGLMTVCIIITRNGFTLVGTSCPIDPANYSVEIGEREARRQAVSQLWPILGYAKVRDLGLPERLAPGGDLHRDTLTRADILSMVDQATAQQREPQPVPGVYGSDDKEG